MSLAYLHKRNIDPEKHLWNLTDAVNGLIDGRPNVTGTVTLTANAASTTVTDNKFESAMAVLLMPTTANAAAAVGTTYVSARTKGAFTLTHANNAQVDRSFVYVRLG